mgnify:CR=1 FL=1
MNETTAAVNSRTDDYDVYIGRGSKWGNPFVMRDKSDHERDRVCDAYHKFKKEEEKNGKEN